MEFEFCQLNCCGQITLLCGFSVDILKMGKMIFSLKLSVTVQRMENAVIVCVDAGNVTRQ